MPSRRLTRKSGSHSLLRAFLFPLLLPLSPIPSLLSTTFPSIFSSSTFPLLTTLSQLLGGLATSLKLLPLMSASVFSVVQNRILSRTSLFHVPLFLMLDALSSSLSAFLSPLPPPPASPSLLPFFAMTPSQALFLYFVSIVLFGDIVGKPMQLALNKVVPGSLIVQWNWLKERF